MCFIKRDLSSRLRITFVKPKWSSPMYCKPQTYIFLICWNVHIFIEIFDSTATQFYKWKFSSLISFLSWWVLQMKITNILVPQWQFLTITLALFKYVFDTMVQVLTQTLFQFAPQALGSQYLFQSQKHKTAI